MPLYLCRKKMNGLPECVYSYYRYYTIYTPGTGCFWCMKVDIPVASELCFFKGTAHLTFSTFQGCITTDPFFLFLPARWVVCVNCPQSHPCAAAGHLMARSAVGGASVTAESASARPQMQGNSMGLAASATTGSVPHTMRKLVMVRTMIEWRIQQNQIVWFYEESNML